MRWCFAKWLRRLKMAKHCGAAEALLHAQQLNVEHDRGVRANQAIPARAVAQIRPDHQATLTADLHVQNSEVPSSDHRASAERERQRRLSDAGVELCAVDQPARVV